MSDNWLMFIPTDPHAIPSRESADKAVQLLRGFALPRNDVTAEFGEQTEFHHGDANWSDIIRCPKCGAMVDIETCWGPAMRNASAVQFESLGITLPCCETTTTLNDLNYEWPAGFSRFVLKAMNPTIQDTTLEQDRALSDALGFELRKIWMHL